MISVKLKKADNPTYIEYFPTLPTWEGLTSRIAEKYFIYDIVVGYCDNGKDTVTLTDDQELQAYYNSLDQPSKLKFVVLDRHTPDCRAAIIASWPSDFDLHELSNTVSLFCWVLSSDSDPFSVDIGKEKTVDSLKKKIKEEQKHTFAGIDSVALRLWKPSPPISYANYGMLKLVKSPEELPGCIELNPLRAIELDFPSPLPEHIHIIVQLPTTSRKRSRSPEEAQASKKIRSDRSGRRWSVNGAISSLSKDQVYFLDPAEQKESQIIVNNVGQGEFVLIMGPRASGKSTQLFRLCETLEQMDYFCFYFTFERVDYSKDTATFWGSVGDALQYASGKRFSISSSANFIDAFAAGKWNKKVVFLLDEMSEMLIAPDEIRDEFLRTLRAIRHGRRQESAIASIVAAGTFSIMCLTTSKSHISPFCVSNSVQMPYFSRNETRKLFGMFAEDNNLRIDEAVMDDIWAKSNGHPGMVCICGRVISDNLKTLLDRQSKTISYDNWQRFPVSTLYDEIMAYNTFRSMVNFLKDPKARPAITLFRTVFAGFFGEVELCDQDEDLADFLTSLGVLSRPNKSALKYQVTSPLIDNLVRLKVIPAQFSNAPTISPSEFHPDSLAIPRVLLESLKCFDKELMQAARWRSYKRTTVLVRGYTQVPRESVYDTELMRILCNWLKQYGWSVTGQWHSGTSEGRHNIVLKKANDTVVLGLLATGDEKAIMDHITRTSQYMSLLSAREGWVIHFTCEDLGSFTPVWQSSAQLTEGVNVIHVIHDINFTRLEMRLYWRDKTGLEEKDSCIVCL